MKNSDYLKEVPAGKEAFYIYDIHGLEKNKIADIKRLPFSIRILAENLLRNLDNRIVNERDVINISNWRKVYDQPVEIPYHPARVLMQDFTGVPAVVDIAAMRDAMKEAGGDPQQINPSVPVELIADHSVQLDYWGTARCREQNVAKEYERNTERYQLLKWAQASFENFTVVPPNSGICHQINLEYLGRVIVSDNRKTSALAYPDSVVGLDSHTTMINGLGILGWGVGGIEAEAVMLGQPSYVIIPEVMGIKITGTLAEGVTVTDINLYLTEMLRRLNVVGKFVEFFGPGIKGLTVPDRATIANMTPEYGATVGFFPVDENTLEYLENTGRGDKVDLVRGCAESLGLFYAGGDEPEYTEVLEFDLSKVKTSVAGPSKPQARIELSDLQKKFDEFAGSDKASYKVELGNGTSCIHDGSVAIAAITSCTNTSNPFLILGAGLLARNAVENGLKVPAHVKTSLTPGSKVVVSYLEEAGLLPYLKCLGFYPAAFGCATCLGNSGPLHSGITEIIREKGLTLAAVVSANRNFEARVHPGIKANYLASPMLVLAFAIAGRVDVDLTKTPLSCDPNGEEVYLKDIWPGFSEIKALVDKFVRRDLYENIYSKIFEGDDFWQSMVSTKSKTYCWDETSTYIKRPPYFEGFKTRCGSPEDIKDARVLLYLGDTVTTDHISPAGVIPEHYPAGRYLMEKGVKPYEFNSYGARRGNHEVMIRGTFGNIRVRNRLVGQKEGSYTIKFPEKEEMFIYDAAVKYHEENTPLIILAGREYGAGSSRDWAAKGTQLLGVRAVIAVSFERIHRSNLIGMGVLPLRFLEGEDASSLGLDGSETFTINGIKDIKVLGELSVKATKKDGTEFYFKTIAMLNTPVEREFYMNGGILPYVLRKMISKWEKS